MIQRLLFLCLVISAFHVYGEEKPLHEPLSDELIEYVNSRVGGTWKAAKSQRFKVEKDLLTVLGTMREHPNDKASRRPVVSHKNLENDIPKEFDARKNWPACKTIKQIRDQSSCGSCWAFAAATAMSDRICIASNETLVDIQISPTDLISCCTDCGFGCVGGWIGTPWDYMRDNGIVTGGEYLHSSSCKPYPFPPCSHHGSTHSELPPCPKKLYSTPECKKQCQKGYSRDYSRDKHFASVSYNLERDEVTIQKEIWLRGPVDAAMNVYADFGTYQKGVYQHATGKLLGGHAVRIIGWGEAEDGTPYWLVANSWNPTWGENGFFKILRGSDHCGIESDVAAGIPIVSNSE